MNHSLQITPAILTEIGCKPVKAHLYAGPIEKTLLKYRMDTLLQRAHWLGQVCHETACLHYLEEIADGSAYEGRKDLGNTQPGDGRMFKGRGLIQLTGRSNYVLFAQHMGYEFPEEVVWKLKYEPQAQCDAAGWFWRENHLNDWADKDKILIVTRIINGGKNGLEDRIRLTNRAKALLGLAMQDNQPVPEPLARSIPDLEPMDPLPPVPLPTEPVELIRRHYENLPLLNDPDNP